MTPRPKDTDKAILRIAATSLAEELTRHDPVSFPESTRPDTIDDLYAVLEDNPHADGYELARALEQDHYWDCDFEIAEIMNGAVHDIGDAIDDAVATWVKAENITPQFAIGDRVIVFKTQFGKRIRADEHVYTIRAINTTQAQYTVACPELGHMTDEVYAAKGIGTIGSIVLFENVEAAP